MDNTDSQKPAAQPRKRPAQVVPFPGRQKPAAPPAPAPAARRPLCSVPNFLAAVRAARKLRPDLSREAIIAASRAPSPYTYVNGEAIIAAVDATERRSAPKRASGVRT